jgi:hypothetical protein
MTSKKSSTRTAKAASESEYYDIPKYDSYPADFPSFDEVKAYIKKNQPVTWPELAKHFKQESDTFIVTEDARFKGKKVIIGHGITELFHRYLQPFTQLDCVVFNGCMLTYAAAGGVFYEDIPRNEIFPYVTLSIKEEK